MVVAILKQLVGAGRRASDITVCDTLAYLVNEYHEILHAAVPEVRYEDFAGKFGRVQVKASTVHFTGVAVPEGNLPDHVPTSFAEAEYLVNLAQLKAHTGGGRDTLRQEPLRVAGPLASPAGLLRYAQPVDVKNVDQYREQVDLMGHAHLGGKTVLYLIDGLFSGKHPIDPVPQVVDRPFNGAWTSSLLASQDPVAIDSVGLRFPPGGIRRLPAPQRGRRLSARGGPCGEAAIGHLLRPRSRHVPSSDWPAWACTNTGTTKWTSNTPETWGQETGIELVAVATAGPAASSLESTRPEIRS